MYENCYFGGKTENCSAWEIVKKRKECQNESQKIFVHIENGQTNKYKNDVKLLIPSANSLSSSGFSRLSKSCPVYPKVVLSIQKLSRLSKSCPVYPKVVPSSKKLSRLSKSCPVEQEVVLLSKKLSRLSKSCPVYPKVVPSIKKFSMLILNLKHVPQINWNFLFERKNIIGRTSNKEWTRFLKKNEILK